MNYAFKMMAVMLALGMLVLQGCVTNDYKRTGVNKKKGDWYSNLETNTPILLNPKKISYKNDTLGRYYKERDVIASLDKKTLMKYACNNGTWDNSNFRHVMEAKRQSLKCKLEDLANTFSSLNTFNNQNLSVQSNNKNNAAYGVTSSKPLSQKLQNDPLKDYYTKRFSKTLNNPSNQTKSAAYLTKIKNKSDEELFFVACDYMNNNQFGTQDSKFNLIHLKEFNRRGHGCSKYGLELFKDGYLPLTKGFKIAEKLEKYTVSDNLICYRATIQVFGMLYWENSSKATHYVKEAKSRGLDCSVGKRNKTVIASKPKTKTYTQPKSTISSAELIASRREADELRKKLNTLENKQKQEQQRIDTDSQEPIINAFTKQDGSNAIISGRVTDNTEIAEALIDGEQLPLTNNGTFKTELYIPRNGLNIEIVAYDRKGNKASKLIKIKRGNIQQASGPTFDTLNPSGKTVKSNPNALALIIGVADYEKTNANALYADKDAQQFYDYARMKLGIPSSNIKELVNAKADRVEIGLAVQDWIARSTKSGKTDIYVFFAGHGLASDDGKNMFLLPYDGSPRLLKASAIRRKELFDNIQQSNPRSVTVFLDTCYSGTTRGTDMLVASRPIMIKAKEQAIPSNFTVFSAAAGDQTSKPLEEAKHGMFSYFLMKGMEGDADSNNDNKITAQELHNYVKENVTQQSSGSQTPELQGDKDRVLVKFN